ncbi:hypothetical protein C1637_10520 [Chryseobacterium lactis]|uniref:TonB C-terminal domain-containing protein n=1 Tax=Chryseobacterium lactis TaxID=1241981 RepID=A0A3G6REV1_CHRLC|nr:hypothetical protein [Chryseobacterium lactis]AZA82063.1 hypothetical protein EG342_09175 [Chryseobacterium lactis]AZB02443.1 hypothetical protein EG341_00030 [Chryseobacterium lactis]PNW14261.1 hypothetical protein C1637_10520 [Chryseobacterium lactis]
MLFNTSIKVLSSLIILTCFSINNKRFESRSESLFQKRTDTIPDSVSQKEMADFLKEERKYWDSTCTSETAKAEADIKKNKLVFFHYFGMVDHYNSNAEMDSLLKKYNIEIDSALTYCTVPEHLQNCYGQVMDREIKKRFGDKFTDSLRRVAEIQFVKKNPNRIYRFEECDFTSRYPGDKDYNDFSKTGKRDFWRDVKYPSDFEFRKDKDLYSYMSADFILYKTGKISDVKINISFKNKKNYKYSSYFINKLRKFVQDTKWVPAKSMGIPVNSEMGMTIHFK